jgi:hypothetical protein
VSVHVCRIVVPLQCQLRHPVMTVLYDQNNRTFAPVSATKQRTISQRPVVRRVTAARLAAAWTVTSSVTPTYQQIYRHNGHVCVCYKT